jgi:hypothetical protein
MKMKFINYRLYDKEGEDPLIKVNDLDIDIIGNISKEQLASLQNNHRYNYWTEYETPKISISSYEYMKCLNGEECSFSVYSKTKNCYFHFEVLSMEDADEI